MVFSSPVFFEQSRVPFVPQDHAATALRDFILNRKNPANHLEIGYILPKKISQPSCQRHKTAAMATHLAQACQRRQTVALHA